jgi:simple sugar transport system substrate-binding protein
MGDAMADGVVKIAIVRSLAVGDHTRQFLDACVSEGRSMGFMVDTFIVEGDEYCRELITRISEADYDGLILSHGSADFTYPALKPVLDRGIKVVTFDALPYENGDPNNGILPGVTSTSQDDRKLARLSLEALISHSGERPAKVIRAWAGPGIPPLDERLLVYDEFVREGKIEELALITPKDFAFSRIGIRDALAVILPHFPEGTVDAVWAPYDEFAKGALDALNEAGRGDIKLISIDISNDDIKLMMAYPSVWVCTAAVDPGLIGTVNMRLLAAKLAGEIVPDTYIFDAQIVETSSLNHAINMANMALMIPGWGQAENLFDNYPWMAELKTAETRYLRLPPLAEQNGAAP